MKCIKRILLIFISVCIIGVTVITDYQEVKAVDIPTAFWGTLEASRAFWTALQAGGGVRGGGVSMAAFEHSNREDMHNLQVQVMLAYTAFCIWKEKTALKTDHPDWTEEQINQQAEVDGRLASDRFQNSAINVSDTTQNLTLKDYGYWKEFCRSMYDISVNGLNQVEINPNTVIKPHFVNNSSITNVSLMDNRGSNIIDYDGLLFLAKGQTIDYVSGNVFEIEPTNIPNDRFRVPYIGYFSTGDYIYILGYYVDFNRLSGQYIAMNRFLFKNYLWVNYGIEYLNRFLSNTNIVVYASNADTSVIQDIESFGQNKDNLAISLGSQNVEPYQQELQNALDNTEAGKAIKEGAKNGQEEIVKDGSIPIKRTSVKTGEETATGAVGWDVPDARTLEGAIAVPDTQDDVVEGMGIITVPEDVVTPKSDDTVAEWAKDEPVSIPDTRDEPISKPIDDVISEQGGEYYPGQISLDEFFPFCIPFDIIYLFNKFRAPERAPVITIPIMYGSGLASALGTDRYNVVIDFNDFVILRDIIRVFALIGFLIGLMQITRNLIRG